MGAAVKLIHLAHPVDTAIQAAVTDHVVGGGRFIFGFGSGFPNPLFAHERGLSHEDRHPRLREALDLILKCWTSEEPFEWDGKYWQEKFPNLAKHYGVLVKRPSFKQTMPQP